MRFLAGPLLKIILSLLQVFFLIQLGGIGFAASLSISPVLLTLSAAQPIAELDLQNNDSQTITVAFKIFSWTQLNGANVQKENTQAILVSPPIVQIPPGQTQIVRLGLLQNVDKENETAYRLLIQQIPINLPQKNGLINVLMNFSLPVFVAPAITENMQYTWSAQILSDSQIRLTLNNLGNVHIQVAQVKIKDITAAEEESRAEFMYVLPGQSSSFIMPMKSNAGDALKVDALVNGVHQTATIKL